MEIRDLTTSPSNCPKFSGDDYKLYFIQFVNKEAIKSPQFFSQRDRGGVLSLRNVDQCVSACGVRIPSSLVEDDHNTSIYSVNMEVKTL
ncbi:unnamed protein product [Nesidiocoris tenuis]|uniref:Uncharacterized protein n=1 Tax=Nesidiocoris tenuis TaxID=355587 RepID=A0A6H5HSE5_9HEMI|nr:unnamed protein product [Nesidiocoris tenuis]